MPSARSFTAAATGVILVAATLALEYTHLAHTGAAAAAADTRPAVTSAAVPGSAPGLPGTVVDAASTTPPRRATRATAKPGTAVAAHPGGRVAAAAGTRSTTPKATPQRKTKKKKRRTLTHAPVTRAPKAPPAPRPAPGAHSGTGYAFEYSPYAGLTPAGLHLYVDRAMSHSGTIAHMASTIAAQLAGFGLPVSYAGYGTPARGDGTLTVTANSAGCSAAGGDTLGTTRPYGRYLPDRSIYIYAAEVTLCPSAKLGTGTLLLATLRHEIGHAVGLAHVTGTYAGQLQLMYPQARTGLVNYRSGDVAGLRKVAALSRAVVGKLPPSGVYQARFSGSGQATFTGVALDAYTPGNEASVTVTDNGTPVASGAANGPDPAGLTTFGIAGDHGFTLTAPWTYGHQYCVIATAAASGAKISLGCVTPK